MVVELDMRWSVVFFLTSKPWRVAILRLPEYPCLLSRTLFYLAATGVWSMRWTASSVTDGSNLWVPGPITPSMHNWGLRYRLAEWAAVTLKGERNLVTGTDDRDIDRYATPWALA